MNIAFIGQKGIGMMERGGGIEKHVTEIATRLVKKGHQVTVYARRRYCPTHPLYQGVRLVCLPTIYRKNLEAILHALFSTVHALTQPYDVIHFHGVGPATLAWIPRLCKPRVKVVVTFHSQDRFHQKWSWVAKTYLHFGEWAAVRFPHACITVSHTLQVLIRQTYHAQAIFIPNGAEIHHGIGFASLSKFGLEPDEYILNVGRIVPQKGLHHLIEAYKQLSTNKKLVIVGAPSFSERYFAELKRLAHHHPGIVFLGQVVDRPLVELYAHAYVYVQPSESEGLPLTVLEAMSCGTAVLVSDIPENVEAINNTGFTFANRDVPDLVAQLDKWLHRPEEVAAMGGRGQEMVKRFFNWEVITDRVEEVYVSLRH